MPDQRHRRRLGRRCRRRPRSRPDRVRRRGRPRHRPRRTLGRSATSPGPRAANASSLPPVRWLMLPKPEHSDHQMVDAVRAQTRRSRHGVPDDLWWSVMEDAVVAGGSRCRHRARPCPGRSGVEARDPAPAELTSRNGRAGRQTWTVPPVGSATHPAWGEPGRLADVVGSLAHGPGDPATWERFSARRRRLERWAFGPPRQRWPGSPPSCGPARLDPRPPGQRRSTR